MVNAPASPSEVTLPAAGPGGSPRRVGSGRRAGQHRSRARGSAESASQRFRGGRRPRPGERGGFRDARPGSVKPYLAPRRQPRAPGILARARGWDDPRPAVLGAHVGAAGPAIFCCEQAAGSAHRLLETPERGEARSWEWGLGSCPRPVSGSPVAADEDGTWLLVREAAESGGACLAPPSVFPGFQGGNSYLGDRQALRAGGWLPGAGTALQLRFCVFQPPLPASPGHAARCVGPRRPTPRPKPGFRWGPLCPRQCRAWACASREPGPAEARRSSLRPGRSTKRPTPGWRAEEAGERAPRAAAERGPPAPGGATPSELRRGASLPGWLPVLNVVKVEEDGRTLTAQGLAILRPETDKG